MLFFPALGSATFFGKAISLFQLFELLFEFHGGENYSR